MTKLFSQTLGQGPDIVLLHGWGIHSGIWQLTLEKMAEDYRVTVVDLPGFGRSEMIVDYSLEGIVNHLLPVVPEKAIWIGWSLGGLIATKSALLYPDRVKKLICVASSPCFLKSENWPGMELSVLKKFNQQLNSDYQATLMRFLLLQFHGITLKRDVLHWLSLTLFTYGKPSVDALNGGLALLEKEDLRDALQKIVCPILYLFGKLDALVPAGISKLLCEYQNNIRTHVLTKASHALFISHMQEFLAEVRTFINE